MAEADIEIRHNNPRFFCYKCNLEISHVLDDFTCPTCRSGFIEEVPAGGNPSAQAHEPMDIFFGSSSGNDAGNPNHGFDPMAFVNAMLQLDGPRSPGPNQNSGAAPLLANILGRGGPRGTATGHHRSGGQSPGSHQISFVINARPRHQGPGEPSGGSAGHTPQANNENPMENALYSFLTDLITGLGGGVGVAGGLPILGNLGDYVWGRDGLDAIVTQLMNQMEGTGPPPLSTDKLENLVSTNITQEQVDKKLQCSVCWDDFALGDEVKQLECDHVYHPDCIVPWLKLHGTCPVCRKDLTGSAGGQDDARASSPSFRPDSSTTEGNRNPFASSSSTNPDEHSTNSNNQYVSRGRGRGPGPGQQGHGNFDTMDFDFD